mmetsp:Transcript_3927/g.15993  ORF Transcript_3927/g.15993 Transcript_3927/m.15993 type:complete len:274 (-) Transcript_3927:552-1373(-)
MHSATLSTTQPAGRLPQRPALPAPQNSRRTSPKSQIAPPPPDPPARRLAPEAASKPSSSVASESPEPSPPESSPAASSPSPPPSSSFDCFVPSANPARIAAIASRVAGHFLAPSSFCSSTSVVAAALGVARSDRTCCPPATYACDPALNSIRSRAYTLFTSLDHEESFGFDGTITANDIAPRAFASRRSMCPQTAPMNTGSNGGLTSNEPASGSNVSASPMDPNTSSTSRCAEQNRRYRALSGDAHSSRPTPKCARRASCIERGMDACMPPAL